MGYIIPIQPLQAQLYANRMLMDDYKFAYISNVQGIQKKSLFEGFLEEKEQEQEEKNRLEQYNPSTPPLFKNFIHPNPINLSSNIVEIRSKGNNVNLYI